MNAYISIGGGWYAEFQIPVLDVRLVKIKTRILQHMFAYRTESAIATDDQIGRGLHCLFC